MRGVHLQVLLLALVQPGLGQSASKPAAVPLNTPVEIELLDTISSETIRDGQQIPFRIVTPVQVDGVTVLEAGTAVIGEVRAVKTSGAWKRPGSFDLILEPIEFGDGSQVKLDFLRPKRLSTKKEKTTTALVAGPVLFYYFPVIPFVVVANSKRGQPYEIRSGERYVVYVIAGEPAAAVAPPAVEVTPEPQRR